MAEKAASPELRWDHGTAYDLFASLYAIHMPGDFGLRASWAAGVRSRLTEERRELFACANLHLGIPAQWLHRLPQPKDSRTILDLLERMKPEEILPTIAINPERAEKCDETFLRVLARKKWDEEDVEAYRQSIGPAHIKAIEHEKNCIPRWLDCWANAAEFGSSYRKGLAEYYEGFFREEEHRISAHVANALARAQEAASRMSLAELFEELSHGIRVEYHLTQQTLVLVPCYWCTPRILYTTLRDGYEIVLFGARPPEASLVPGDSVPAQLLLALEALSDPTRLAILRALLDEPLTQAGIARKLRLRPPTISHHLKSLRLAGLIAYIGTGKDETRYGTRVHQVEQTCALLKEFLKAT